MIRPRLRVRRVVQCPYCGEDNPSYEVDCEACGKPLAIYIGPARRGTFSLASIMLMVGAISVGLGALRVDLFFGVVSLGLFVPALARTLYYAEQDRAWGNPMPALDKVGLFFTSILIAMVIEFITIVTFALTLTLIWVPVPNSNAWFVGGAIVAGLAALGAGYWAGRYLLPRRYY